MRDWLKKNVLNEAAQKIRIMHGGTVTEKETAELIAKPDFDGFLVSGAALKDALVEIVQACNEH